MPFTLSHPVIILPFGFKKHKYIDFTALVLGSMAPDFEYFYRFRLIRTVGHTIAGQLYYNLPVVLLIAILYHYVIKKPLIQHLPKPYDSWYYPYEMDKWKLNSLKRIVIVGYSGIIGCLSHVIWDGFTHGTGCFVQRLPVLRNLLHIGGRDIPVYSMLQAFSSLMGIILIMIFIFYMGYTNRRISRPHHGILSISKWIYWGGVVVTACVTLLMMYQIIGRRDIGHLVVYVVNGFFIGISFMSLIARIGAGKR